MNGTGLQNIKKALKKEKTARNNITGQYTDWRNALNTPNKERNYVTIIVLLKDVKARNNDEN